VPPAALFCDTAEQEAEVLAALGNLRGPYTVAAALASLRAAALASLRAADLASLADRAEALAEGN